MTQVFSFDFVPNLLLAASCCMVGCAAQVAQRPPAPFAGVVGPLIIAHRGGSLEAPENTVSSIRHGVEVGADWQELDVVLSSDDEVVVIHDDTVDRTTDGRGYVEKLSLAELRKLKAGRPKVAGDTLTALQVLNVRPADFGDRYAHEGLPTLAEVLAVPGGRLMIELKKTKRVQKLVQKVLAAVNEAHANDRVALGSFELDLLDEVHLRDPSMPLIGIAEEQAMFPPLFNLPISVLAVRIDLVEEALQAVPRGVAVWSWTAYSAEMAHSLVARGAHGIITDAPAQVISVLRAPPPVNVELSH